MEIMVREPPENHSVRQDVAHQIQHLRLILGLNDLVRLFLVVDHDRADEQQVMDAYGMALHLAGRGIRADWWIARDKPYEGVDFQAETDDAPDPATAGPDGAVATRDYRAGPFIIHDPNMLTTDVNEAWEEIDDLRTLRGYDPIIHEIRSDRKSVV